MMDSAWQEISHEEMQAAADLLTAEMEEVKATLQIQARLQNSVHLHCLQCC